MEREEHIGKAAFIEAFSMALKYLGLSEEQVTVEIEAVIDSSWNESRIAKALANREELPMYGWFLNGPVLNVDDNNEGDDDNWWLTCSEE